MTPADFIKWLDGFAEGLGGPPNAEQWAKVLEKSKQVAPSAIPNYAPNAAKGVGIGCYPLPQSQAANGLVRNS